MDKNVFEIMQEENRRKEELRNNLINGGGTSSVQEIHGESNPEDQIDFEEAIKELSQVECLTDDKELIDAVGKWLPAQMELLSAFDECLNNLENLNTVPSTLEDFMALEDQINEFERLKIRELFCCKTAFLVDEWFRDEDNEQIFDHMNCISEYALNILIQRGEAIGRIAEQIHKAYADWVDTGYRNKSNNPASCPICTRIKNAKDTLAHAKETYQRLVRSRDVVHVMRGDDPECYAHAISGLNALQVVTQEMHALVELMDLLMMLIPLDITYYGDDHFEDMSDILNDIMDQAEKTGQLVDFMADRLDVDDAINSECLDPVAEAIINICFPCDEEEDEEDEEDEND